ncbi:uncharacterized protein LOC110006207 isoform X2 [Xyrichtys novacula]|uniref:Uncharacterized protein LOC110006207 isoform X2 n=1 Tax=Xyrichtys novacula TaxID=13765 RepID=A0AAV1H4C9_XYRNO|nr:uncharacterized protein LOC110006207 isoform X2 [Xyrichtys novacula]
MAPEWLTVIVASGSCVAIGLVILMLVVVFYGKDPLCCRFRVDRTEQYSDEGHHYHSRHTLIGVAHDEEVAAVNQGAAGSQLPGRLFIIGKPNDYYLSGGLPRLPSYESVRKKDRQRQIHSMISQRFGLSGCPDEPPPPYEETLRQSVEILPSHLHSLDAQHLVQDCSSQDTHDSNQPFPALQDLPSSSSSSPSSSSCPAHSSRFLSI